MEFKYRIRDLRRESGFTAEELGKAVGLSRYAILYWEKGKNYPQVDVCLKLCKIFNCSMDYLLGLTDLRKMENSELEMQERVIEVLKTVFDPEIPVNIYDLGLIYRIEFNEDNTELSVDMTLTAPNCPAADFIVEDVRQKLETITGIEKVEVNLVFEPEWDKEMMSEEAKMELGFL